MRYDIRVWIGPGVRKETYIKYGEKLDFFLENIHDKRDWEKFLIKMSEGKVGIDLVGYTVKQLTDCGVKREKIEISDVDTIVDTNYFSHYRAGLTHEKEGRFVTVVMLKK